MGLFDIFKNGQRGQFVEESKHRDNLDMQVGLSPRPLELLRNFGVGKQRKLKLEYFFYTNTLEKAAQLANHLQNMNYSVDFGKAAGDQDRFIVTGWTNKMNMDDKTVQAWTKKMCKTGYAFDCEFDGWGTFVKP